MPRRESEVQRAVLDYLRIRGILAWRNNKGMAMLPGRKGKPMPVRFGGMDGAPDILGVMPGGCALAVECKRPLGPRGGTGGSELTDDQRNFKHEFECAGGLFILARGIDDIDAGLSRWAQRVVTTGCPSPPPVTWADRQDTKTDAS